MPIHFKACPRCYGDVAGLSDMYGAYFDCIQCGSMPDQLVINGSNRKESGISIDANIETLGVLNSRGEISAFSLDRLVKDESLEKRLKAMGQYGYVAVALPNGKTVVPEHKTYSITLKGKEVLDTYMVFVKNIREKPESENAGISS